jgi:hypothetical protein
MWPGFLRLGRDTMDLTSFLTWLVVSGGSISVVSWLFERMNWFQALASDVKDYTIFGASVVVGCGALAVVTYVPAEVLAAIAPYFLVVSGTFATVFMGKAFHAVDKKSGVSVELIGTLEEIKDEPEA